MKITNNELKPVFLDAYYLLKRMGIRPPKPGAEKFKVIKMFSKSFSQEA